MKRKMLFVILMLVCLLSGCSDPNEKFTGMNGDYKLESGIIYNAGKEQNVNSNSGLFFTITDMEKVNYRAGTDVYIDGTITEKEINDDVITCKVSFEKTDDFPWSTTYFTYDLKDPDIINYKMVKEENQTEPSEANLGVVLNYVRKAEGEKDTITFDGTNFETFLTVESGDDVIDKSQVLEFQDGEVTDIDMTYYLKASEGYDSLNLDVTVTGDDRFLYEKATVTFTLYGTISNPWAVLESLGTTVDPAKKKMMDVSEMITIELDENGNGQGTVTIPCFGEFNLENCINDYDLRSKYTGSGTAIIKR